MSKKSVFCFFCGFISEKRALRLKQNIYLQSAKFYGISAKETPELKFKDGQI